MFFEKAYEGRNRWWRWLLTIAGTLAAIFVGQIPLVMFVVREAKRLGISQGAFFSGDLPAGVDRNLFLLLFLSPFVLGFGVLWFLINWLHRKPLRSVMTGRPSFQWGRALVGFAVWFAVLGLAMFGMLPADAYHNQFEFSKFWPLLLIALLLLPIQTTLEEVFFRGYLMQGISLLARNKIVPLILVTVLFALVHYSNPEFSDNYGIGAAEYFLMSSFLGLAAVLDDGLEVPCGIHAANNIFLAAIISTSGSTLQTNAVFETNIHAFGDHVLIISILPYFLCFAILYWAFGWRFSKLFEPITPPADFGEGTGKDI